MTILALNSSLGIDLDLLSKDIALVLGAFLHHTQPAESLPSLVCFYRIWNAFGSPRLADPDSAELFDHVAHGFLEWIDAKSHRITAGIVYALYLMYTNNSMDEERPGAGSRGTQGLVAEACRFHLRLTPELLDILGAFAMECVASQTCLDAVRCLKKLKDNNAIRVVSNDIRPIQRRLDFKNLETLLGNLKYNQALDIAHESNRTYLGTLNNYMNLFAESVGIGSSAVQNDLLLKDLEKSFAQFDSARTMAKVIPDELITGKTVEEELCRYYRVRMRVAGIAL